MPHPVNKLLLQKFIAGECTPEEAAQVNQFLATTEGKTLLETILQAHWQQAEKFEPVPHELQEWKLQLNQHITPATATTKHMFLPAIGRRSWQRAAVWTALLLSMALVYKMAGKITYSHKTADNTLAMKTVTTPRGRRATIHLPDSSSVVLGPGSTFSYPIAFQGASREVILEGEAWFEVAGNPATPFKVRTGNIYTQVLGTTFKIAAFAGKQVQVGVASGKVRVDEYLNGQPVKQLALLTAGKQVSYTPEGTLTAGSFAVQDAEAWLKGRLIFNGTPLQELAETLTRWRDVQFEIQRADLKTMPVTVTVDNQVTLHQLLEGLSVIGDFKYTINKHKIIIY